MKMLCPISDWKERIAERGKGKGNVLRERYIVAADLWNWIVGIQSKDENGPIVAERYYGNMRTLIPSINVDKEKTSYARIKESLEQLTECKSDVNFDQDPSLIGKDFDDVFNVSYLREQYPTVYTRLFGDDLADQESNDDQFNNT